jgi:hypothetical protein
MIKFKCDHIFSLDPVLVYDTDIKNKNIIQISCGFLHSLILTDNSEIFSFGFNNYGQIGDGTNTNRFLPTPIFLTQNLKNKKIKSISAGYFHSLFHYFCYKILSEGILTLICNKFFFTPQENLVNKKIKNNILCILINLILI